MLDICSLIQRAKQGDSQALGALLELYRNYLTVLARLQIGPALQGRVSPSDLVQDTFLNAKKGLSGFQGQSEPELMAWLRRIMAHRLTDLVRRHRGGGQDIKLENQYVDQMQQTSASLVNLIPATEPSPSEHASHREQEVLLANALAELPEDYREVLVLRHLKGLKFGEIANQMDRSLDSVKNVWVRAVGRLRDVMESKQ